MGLTLLKPIMPPETRMLFSFCFGSLGQRFLLAVGFSLPTAHEHRRQRGDRGYHYRDIKGNAFG
jgi:hypothetical protein